jgi:hypothetical protein
LGGSWLSVRLFTQLYFPCHLITELIVIVQGYFYRIFPIEAILAAPLFAIFGGGDCVFLSAVLAVIADLAADDIQRSVHSRVNVFRTNTFGHLGRLI